MRSAGSSRWTGRPARSWSSAAAAPGRANAAPLLVLDDRLDVLPTSGSTRRVGLVALEDVRPTLAGGASDGDDGSVIRVVADGAATATATRLDRRVAALVAARTWAIPLLCLAAVLALAALLAAWRGVGRPGRAASAARTLLALTLALPPGYLVASMAEPLATRLWVAVLPGLRDPGMASRWAVAWVVSGIAAAAVLTAVALRLDRPATGDVPAPAAGSSGGPGRVAAPALLGAVLLAGRPRPGPRRPRAVPAAARRQRLGRRASTASATATSPSPWPRSCWSPGSRPCPRSRPPPWRRPSEWSTACRGSAPTSAAPSPPC